jgi:hypothetical protein
MFDSNCHRNDCYWHFLNRKWSTVKEKKLKIGNWDIETENGRRMRSFEGSENTEIDSTWSEGKFQRLGEEHCWQIANMLFFVSIPTIVDLLFKWLIPTIVERRDVHIDNSKSPVLCIVLQKVVIWIWLFYWCCAIMDCRANSANGFNSLKFQRSPSGQNIFGTTLRLSGKNWSWTLELDWMLFSDR